MRERWTLSCYASTRLRRILLTANLRAAGILTPVATVDSFHGRESPIVIVSLVVTGRVTSGFMQDPRRILVGLSRVQEQLYLVGKKSLWVHGYQMNCFWELNPIFRSDRHA